jgi:hypothetical protein
VIAVAILGGVAAWVAVLAGAYFAPWPDLPVLAGVGLVMLVAVLRFAQIGHRPTLLAGTVAAVVLAVAGQHYLHYLQYWRPV